MTDVLRELEERVGPLEKQSKTAKEYLKLRDREKELDIHLFLHEYEQTQKELQENGQRQEIVPKDLEETRVKHESIKEKNNALQKESEELLAKIEETEEKKEKLSSQKEELDSKQLFLRHKIESNERMIAHYEEIIGQNQEDRKAKEEKVREQQRLQAEEKEKLSAMEEERARPRTGKRSTQCGKIEGGGKTVHTEDTRSRVDGRSA